METRNDSQSKAMGGVVLVVIGLMAFAAQIWQNSVIGLWVLLALGVLFLAWGVVTRNVGPLIPGGILSGLGVGVLLANGMPGAWSEMTNGGIVVLCLGLGFLSIVPLSAMVSGKAQLWAMIPGGILTLVGVALFAGNMGVQLLALAGYAWPLILIAIGVYIIWKRTVAHA